MVKRKSEDTGSSHIDSRTSILKSNVNNKKHKTFDDDGNNGSSTIDESVDFPRGGGTVLSQVESAQARREGKAQFEKERQNSKKKTKATSVVSTNVLMCIIIN